MNPLTMQDEEEKRGEFELVGVSLVCEPKNAHTAHGKDRYFCTNQQT